jgi:hypothetical protein
LVSGQLHLDGDGELHGAPAPFIQRGVQIAHAPFRGAIALWISGWAVEGQKSYAPRRNTGCEWAGRTWGTAKQKRSRAIPNGTIPGPFHWLIISSGILAKRRRAGISGSW